MIFAPKSLCLFSEFASTLPPTPCYNQAEFFLLVEHDLSNFVQGRQAAGPRGVCARGRQRVYRDSGRHPGHHLRQVRRTFDPYPHVLLIHRLLIPSENSLLMSNLVAASCFLLPIPLQSLLLLARSHRVWYQSRPFIHNAAATCRMRSVCHTGARSSGRTRRSRRRRRRAATTEMPAAPMRPTPSCPRSVHCDVAPHRTSHSLKVLPLAVA